MKPSSAGRSARSGHWPGPARQTCPAAPAPPRYVSRASLSSRIPAFHPSTKANTPKRLSARFPSPQASARPRAMSADTASQRIVLRRGGGGFGSGGALSNGRLLAIFTAPYRLLRWFWRRWWGKLLVLILASPFILYFL